MSSTQRVVAVVAVLALRIALAYSFSWEFVVARSNKLEFYNQGTLAYTAAPTSHRIKWIIYDPVRDRVLFADTRSSKMSAASFDIATKITQPLIMKKTKRYFKRFAYDPATELLFGSRVNKIYSFSIKSGNKNKITRNGDLVIDLESTVLRELAVDSCGGYIYWTASNTIERALFNGSDREVVIGKGLAVKLGFAIDTQKIYWIESQEYNEGGFSIESADLNGKNRKTLYSEVESDFIPDKVIVSKYFVYWRDGIESAFVWQFPKNPPNDRNVKPNKISIPSNSNCFYGFQDITANYNVEERIWGVPNCLALKSLLPGDSDCVNGRKVIGEPRCECAQGYIGVRCDVSVCHNYCYQGDCDVAAGGQPKCSCNAGYSGERCEVNLCQDYCLNNGTCSLTNHSEPVCDCTGPYKGEKCDVPICKDYCFQGECSVSAEGQPKCSCNAGYSGERCEISPCHDHCLNNGTCSLTSHSEPVCNCTGPYQGERCEVPICKDYCFQGECSVSPERQPKCRCNVGYTGERCHVPICENYCFQGECTVSAEGQPKCRCNAGYSGERCEISPCHDFCLNNGICSLTSHSEPVCNCTGPYQGERCDVSICKDYCFLGECSVSAEGQPKCRCNVGYTGERCHVPICENYCFQGECSVSAEGQPKCSCNAGYSGERCEVSPCHDYCLNNGTCFLTNNTEPDCYDGMIVLNNGTTSQRACTVSAEGQQPKCSCNAGYSGERCEVSLCHDYCLNNGTCSLTNHSEPVCDCTGPYKGEKCDVPICKDYCFQGECTVSAEGQPKCRCDTGYSGDRCEVSPCHDYCLNNGTCFLTNNTEPDCYDGMIVLNNGTTSQRACTVSAEGQPKCSCNAGYSGERCEVSPCHDYCLNNGTCFLTNNTEPDCYDGMIVLNNGTTSQRACTVSAEGQPKCSCNAGYSGERCEVSPCHDYCLNNGTCFLTYNTEPDCYDGMIFVANNGTTSERACTVSAEGQQPKCSCNAGYSGERCEVSLCHDYCLNNGTCSLTNHSEPVCDCTGPYKGEKCDVPICKDYCFQGECTVSAEGQPKCRCDTGYSGERCEVSPCHDYCLNNGTCFLTNNTEPDCYDGMIVLNNGTTSQRACTVSAEGQQPKCSCNAGYSGERCEVSPCHDYCLNNGTCFLTNNTEPDCYDGMILVANNGTTSERACTVSAEGQQPKCSCNAGYSGERCEFSLCQDYCLHGGTCSLTNHGEPVCACAFPYEGDICQDSSVATTVSVYTKTYHDKFHWLPIVNGILPPNAIIGGFEEEDTYIARANHSTGSLCPGKYVPSQGRGYIAWGGKEHSQSEESIEILCGTNAAWVRTSLGNSSLPANAFIGGRTGGKDEVDGEPLYIGRDMIGNDRVLGKVHVRHNSCYFPYHGKEKFTHSCEILVEPDDEI